MTLYKLGNKRIFGHYSVNLSGQIPISGSIGNQSFGSPTSDLLDPGGSPFVSTGAKDWNPNELGATNVLDAQNWIVFGGRGNLNAGDWTTFVPHRSSLTAPPDTPPNVLEMRWNAGMPGGQGPFHYAHWFQGNGTNPTAAKIWIKYFLWLDPQWTNNGNTGTKLFWLRPPQAGSWGANHYVNLADGQGPFTSMFALRTQFQSSPGQDLNKNYSGLSSSGLLGRWMKVEHYIELNSAPGVADGIYKVAIDGVLRINLSNVIYIESVTPSNMKFAGIAFNPTYGGGPNPVPYDLYCYMDSTRFKWAP